MAASVANRSEAVQSPVMNAHMSDDWQAALDRLYGFANWETRPPGTPHEFALDRIERLLDALGRPHHSWPAVHIGGTNGKGSTSAFVAETLGCAGYRVGLYTSPHMHTVRERIRVGRTLIAETEVIAWLDEHAALLDSLTGLTTFEVLTALAFDHFARAGVDIAVIEVGLGGRLDTTRVVRSVVSVLTPIGLDHREILGDTLRQIASDKVGILRPGVPVVSAPQAPEALAVITAEAHRLGCPLSLVGRDTTWTVRDSRPPTLDFVVHPPSGDASRRDPSTDPVPPISAVADDGGPASEPLHIAAELRLAGPHQHVNAAVAATALAVLRQAGWAITAAHIGDGLSRTTWPGRYDRWSLASGATLVVDGAHNPHGAAALIAALRHDDPSDGYAFVLGFGGGKDVDGMLDVLVPCAAAVFTVRADHPKALAADAVAARVLARAQAAIGAGSRLDDRSVTPCATMGQALEAAIAAAGPGGVAVATGSIFVAADAREAWLDALGTPITDRDAPRP